MLRGLIIAGLLLAGLGIQVFGRPADEPSAAERGRVALLTRSFNPTIWSTRAYDNAWRQWGLSTRPANFEEAFREHYGLPEAPYPNDGYPMGMRTSNGLLGKGLSTDCLVCHGGSIGGHSYIGLPKRDRAAILQSQSEKYPQEYGPLVEQYLKNLADQSSEK